MTDALPALLGLLGVFVGAAMANRAASRQWIRQLKLDRYNAVMHLVDEGNEGVLRLVGVLATPEEYADSDAHVQAAAEVVNDLKANLAGLAHAAVEFAVFAGRGVAPAVHRVITAWESAVSELIPDLETDSRGSKDTKWPPPEVVVIATRRGKQLALLEKQLTERHSELIERVRWDLGVGFVAPWRQLVWWLEGR